MWLLDWKKQKPGIVLYPSLEPGFFAFSGTATGNVARLFSRSVARHCPPVCADEHWPITDIWPLGRARPESWRRASATISFSPNDIRLFNSLSTV
jgi:hypothetical protein